MSHLAVVYTIPVCIMVCVFDHLMCLLYCFFHMHACTMHDCYVGLPVCCLLTNRNVEWNIKYAVHLYKSYFAQMMMGNIDPCLIYCFLVATWALEMITKLCFDRDIRNNRTTFPWAVCSCCWLLEYTAEGVVYHSWRQSWSHWKEWKRYLESFITLLGSGMSRL